MEISPQKEAQIWNRVLGAEAEQPTTPQTQAALTPGSVMDAMQDEVKAACAYRTLAQHYGGAAKQTLLKIAEDEQCHARRLAAIYFLQTGSKACPEKATPPCITCRTETIRARYQEELADIENYAALAAVDSSFAHSFAEIAEDERRHADLLLCVIQETV
ncbi:MAG: hypothetical protein IJT07_01210 [Oscillospiraceae bacterium]|nr:hypothetical protein [Oscillospiraceae bacterium]